MTGTMIGCPYGTCGGGAYGGWPYEFDGGGGGGGV
jgi:hypothetical protein